MAAKLELVRAEYQGFEVKFDERGWLNATQIAEKYGKRPVDWLRLPETEKYIEAAMEIESNCEKISLLKTRPGRPDRGGGTWLHPALVVAFGRWLDPRFAVWCDKQVRLILSGQHPHFDWLRSRHKASATIQVMNDILKHMRAEIGKATETKNYVNEANLINGCLTGRFRPPEGGRDGLTLDELGLVVKLEERNTVLIGRGLGYAERKSILIQYAIDLRPAPPALAQ